MSREHSSVNAPAPIVLQSLEFRHQLPMPEVVTEHLAEYATLKAMGYKQRYLLSIVFQEALMLAIMGYIPGFLMSAGLYKISRNATLLPIAMESQRSIFVLSLTFFMCFISGVIAVRKLKDADPADIF